MNRIKTFPSNSLQQIRGFCDVYLDFFDSWNHLLPILAAGSSWF